MRLLVTRPEPEATRTAQRLIAEGHQAVVAPVLTLQPTGAALPANRFAALVFTSPRTPPLLNRDIVAQLADLAVFCVGDRTAEAAAAAGFGAVRSAAGDVNALAQLIRAADLPRGARLLSLGGEERAGDLARLVDSAGLTIRTVALYRMVAAAAVPTAMEAFLNDPTEAGVLHYSPRSAEAFARLVVARGLAAKADRLVHFCLSEAVARPLRTLPCSRIMTAARPDEAALLTLIAT